MPYLTYFFFRNGMHSRRTLWMALLGFLPVIAALAVVIVRPLLADTGISMLDTFSKMSFFIYLHFLLPVMSIFVGAAIIGDEVDDMTLTYLLVRPVPRWKMVFSKALAGVMTLAIILVGSLLFSYLIMVSQDGGYRMVRGIGELSSICFVMILGLMVYVPLFGFFGGVIKKPVLAGLLFVFGWENSVAFLPANVRFFTVVHYLHSIFPSVSRFNPNKLESALLGLIVSATRTSPLLSVTVLLAMTASLSAMMISLLYLKEYRLEQSE